MRNRYSLRESYYLSLELMMVGGFTLLAGAVAVAVGVEHIHKMYESVNGLLDTMLLSRQPLDYLDQLHGELDSLSKNLTNVHIDTGSYPQLADLANGVTDFSKSRIHEISEAVNEIRNNQERDLYGFGGLATLLVSLKIAGIGLLIHPRHNKKDAKEHE